MRSLYQGVDMPHPNKKNKKRNKKEESPLKKIFQEAGLYEVFENETASLQDPTYSFDDENTGSDDIHVISDFDSVTKFEESEKES
jgi:hypothetical protein